MICLAVTALLGVELRASADSLQAHRIGRNGIIRKQINFVSRTQNRTPNPAGWEAYDGAPYTADRGYGWTQKGTDFLAVDGGPDGLINPSRGAGTSVRALGRLE